MSDHIRLIQNYLKDVIQDAEQQLSGSKSLLDFAARIRRNTAREVLDFVASLPRDKSGPMDVDAGRGDVIPFIHRAARNQPSARVH